MTETAFGAVEISRDVWSELGWEGFAPTQPSSWPRRPPTRRMGPCAWTRATTVRASVISVTALRLVRDVPDDGTHGTFNLEQVWRA